MLFNIDRSERYLHQSNKSKYLNFVNLVWEFNFGNIENTKTHTKIPDEKLVFV